MKNKLIDSVIAKMSGSLSPNELFSLREVLEQELSGCDTAQTPDNENQTKKANDEFAKQFISAQ